jgi:hypothetical protein
MTIVARKTDQMAVVLLAAKLEQKLSTGRKNRSPRLGMIETTTNTPTVMNTSTQRTKYCDQ